MLTKFTKNNEKGFTLIELMIVIAIIGILAAIAIPQFSAYRQRSYNSSANADLRNAATAQEAWYVDNMVYTATETDLRGTYGLFTSAGVVFTIITANTTLYTMEAYHTSGSRTYSITGPGGSVN
jgi:prepilin-type N-terminal cleavage/methylation domain-containing protein